MKDHGNIMRYEKKKEFHIIFLGGMGGVGGKKNVHVFFSSFVTESVSWSVSCFKASLQKKKRYIIVVTDRMACMRARWRSQKIKFVRVSMGSGCWFVWFVRGGTTRKDILID